GQWTRRGASRPPRGARCGVHRLAAPRGRPAQGGDVQGRQDPGHRRTAAAPGGGQGDRGDAAGSAKGPPVRRSSSESTGGTGCEASDASRGQGEPGQAEPDGTEP